MNRYVSYLGIPYPHRLVFQIGLSVGAFIIAVAFFDLFIARKREIQYRIKQAKYLANHSSDFADDSTESSASPVTKLAGREHLGLMCPSPKALSLSTSLFSSSSSPDRLCAPRNPPALLCSGR